MDWANQNKLRGWLIIGLLLLNLATVSIIWVLTSRTAEPGPREERARATESVNLMKKVVGLNDTQAEQVARILDAQREESKTYNDGLSKLKRNLAEELFKEKPDSSVAEATAAEIGVLQSKVEMVRYRRFRDLLAICTPDQAERLKPVVFEVFGRKPPREESLESRPPGAGVDAAPPVSGAPDGGRRERLRPLPGDGPAPPPSADEKLQKYTERLNLSESQIGQAREILLDSRKKGEDLQAKAGGDEAGKREARERIRNEEDQKIMQILTPAQRDEFAKMAAKRRQ